MSAQTRRAREPERALVGNASDEEQVERAQTIEKLEARSFDKSLATVLATYEGRHVIWMVISECGVFRTPENFAEHGRLAFSVGAQDRGRWMIAQVERVDYDAYLAMQQEHNDRVRNRG